MTKRRKNILIIFLAIAVIFITVGFSFWIIIAPQGSAYPGKYSGSSDTLPDVAYIVRNKVKHNTYKTVEQALVTAQSGDTARGT